MPRPRRGGPYRDQRPALRERIAELERVRADATREIATLREQISGISAVRRCERAIRGFRVLRLLLRYVTLPTAGVALALVAVFAFLEEMKEAYGDEPASETILRAARGYAARHDECPTVDALIAARRLDEYEETDPWGNEFVIECEGSRIEVRSAGPDRQLDTDDDISTDASRRRVRRDLPSRRVAPPTAHPASEIAPLCR